MTPPVLTSSKPAPKLPFEGEFKTLRVYLTPDELDAVRWAAKHAGAGDRYTIPLNEFTRAVLLNAVREVVRNRMKLRSRGVPQGLVAMLDTKRANGGDFNR